MKRYCVILFIAILIVVYTPENVSAAPREDDIVMEAEVGFDGLFQAQAVDT